MKMKNKRKATPRKKNLVARDLRTPKYKMRVERDKSKYYRKRKHKNETAYPDT